MTEAIAKQAVGNDVTSHVAGSVGAAAEEGMNVRDEEYEDGNEDEEEDENEAEEIARRLKQQPWADINKAQAAQPLAVTITALPSPGDHAPSGPKATLSRKRDGAFHTMKGILTITANDALAHSTLASTVVSGANNNNVLNVLNE